MTGRIVSYLKANGGCMFYELFCNDEPKETKQSKVLFVELGNPENTHSDKVVSPCTTCHLPYV